MTEVKVSQADEDAFRVSGLCTCANCEARALPMLAAHRHHAYEEAATVARAIAERSEPHKASGAFEAAHAIEALTQAPADDGGERS